jgi:hypothetical protein
MDSIIQQLHNRIADAEKRVNEAGAALHAADKVYNVAVSELNVWRSALDAETRVQQASQAVFAGMEELVPPLVLQDADEISATNLNRAIAVQTGGTNKTELIRSLLRQNPAGLTPPQIWERVADQFKHRPYLYSVLKRLKDHDEVVTRRNKYMLRPQEVNQSLEIQ